MDKDHNVVKWPGERIVNPLDAEARLKQLAEQQAARTIPPGTLHREPPVVLDKRPLKR